MVDLVRVTLFGASLITFINAAYYDTNEWDIQDPDLTEEIKRLTTRPHPYLNTPEKYFPMTEITAPEEFYEAEYADKPCQDKADVKIKAGDVQQVFAAKDEPKVIVDKLKVSKVNGSFQVEQEMVPKDASEIPKPKPVGDNVEINEDKGNEQKNIVAEKNDGEQINLKDIEEGKNVPIGDNVAGDPIKKNAAIGDGLDANNDNPEDEPKNVPIGDDLKVSKEELKEGQNDENPKPIGDNVQIHVDGKPNIADEQLNMKEAVNAVKEEPVDDKRKEKDQQLYALVNAMNPAVNMRNLYNIAEEPVQNMKDNQNEVIGSKVNQINREKMEGKVQVEPKKSMNDLQIKIKLELDKLNNNMKHFGGLNSLLDLGRKSLGGLDGFNSMMNRMMPFANNVLNDQNSLGVEKAKPQSFYMKYMQIDPRPNGLNYQYYYFQKFANSRYNSAKSGAEPASSLSDGKSSQLLSKLLGQVFSPLSMLSPLSFLNPVGGASHVRFPLRIYMNEKSAAKYDANCNRMDALPKGVRGKRAVETTERPLFNEGPFKVNDPECLKWAKDFIKEFPKEDRPTTFHIIHQQPTSKYPYHCYHPPEGQAATYYTIEPTVTRKLNPGEPLDPCLCCNDGKGPPTPATRDEDCVFRVGDKDPFYPETDEKEK